MNVTSSRTPWILAGILAVLLVITLYLWATAKKDLLTVLEKGNQNLAAARMQITADCEGPNKNDVNCRADMAALSTILTQVSSDLKNATTSATTTAY